MVHSFNPVVTSFEEGKAPIPAPELYPCTTQKGDAIGAGFSENWIKRIDWMTKDYYCKNPYVKYDNTLGNIHPVIELRYPVQNVHVELLDAGPIPPPPMNPAGDEDALPPPKPKPVTLWEVTYNSKQSGVPLHTIDGDAVPEIGDQREMLPICGKPDQERRLILHVIGDDIFQTGGVNRSIDETVQFETALYTKDCPRRSRCAKMGDGAQVVAPFRTWVIPGPHLETDACLLPALLAMPSSNVALKLSGRMSGMIFL